MAKIRKTIPTRAEYTESFSSFRGIAPEGDETVSSRLAYVENLYRDYDGETVGAIESVPGYRLINKFEKKINGIHFHKGELIVHAATTLYHVAFSADRQSYTLNSLLEISDNKSISFPFGTSTFILDSVRFVEITGSAEEGLSAKKRIDHYIPTLYLNGTPFEDRNLLSDTAYEEYDIIDARENAAETEGLYYSTLEGEELECALTGVDSTVSGEVDIPGYTIIGGLSYRVSRIEQGAFTSNSRITAVRIAEGVRVIAPMAFYNCQSLNRVTTPLSLVEIGESAFNTCPNLKSVYLRLGLKRIGNAAFAASLGIENVYFEGTAEELSYIEGSEVLGGLNTVPLTTDSSLRVEFKLCSTPKNVVAVSVDGNSASYTLRTLKSGEKRILMTLASHWQYNGKRLRAEVVLQPLSSDFNGSGEAGAISGFQAIRECTIAELYDGRVFLSGNPSLPSTVFYCSRTRAGNTTPLYFGEHNYWSDGTAAAPITALLSVRGELAVFKSADDGMGSIFIHVGKDTGDGVVPRIYPVSELHSGTPSRAGAICFNDEALFLSDGGLMGIEKQQVNLERSVSSRSGSINSHLLREDLSGARLCKFGGYLAVCCGDSIYLADPRAAHIGKLGNKEFEWFIIKDIGEHTGIKTAYRYSDSSPNASISVKHGMVGEIVVGYTVFSRVMNGATVYFTREGSNAYAVYKSDEKVASGRNPPTDFAYDGRTLYFVTESGSLYAFNNDLRGIMPAHIKSAGEIDEEEYLATYGRRIHPYFYSFEGMSVRYAMRTVKTNCALPHLTKSTVKGSLVIKCSTESTGGFVCEVGTDRRGYRECAKINGGCLDFSDLSFDALSLSPGGSMTIPLNERERDWVEKDITVYAKTIGCPVRIWGIAFRYKVKGRIKQ